MIKDSRLGKEDLRPVTTMFHPSIRLHRLAAKGRVLRIRNSCNENMHGMTLRADELLCHTESGRITPRNDAKSLNPRTQSGAAPA